MNQEKKDLRNLNRRLHRMVETGDIKSKLRTLSPHLAESEKEGNKIRCKIDPETSGEIPALIHELLHWVFEKETDSVPYEIHEPWIAATEKQLFEFLQEDKRRMNWWRKTVRRLHRR